MADGAEAGAHIKLGLIPCSFPTTPRGRLNVAVVVAGAGAFRPVPASLHSQAPPRSKTAAFRGTARTGVWVGRPRPSGPARLPQKDSGPRAPGSMWPPSRRMSPDGLRQNSYLRVFSKLGTGKRGWKKAGQRVTSVLRKCTPDVTEPGSRRAPPLAFPRLGLASERQFTSGSAREARRWVSLLAGRPLTLHEAAISAG